jgi:glc operon protein GlcG
MQEARSLGLKEAEMICDACIQETIDSKDNKEVVGAGYPVAVCVIDRHGTVLCHKVMDGTFSLAARLSRTKAQSALELLRDTKVQREICQSRGIGLMPYEFSSVEHTEIPGGCVVKTSDGNVVGAVGISGRSPQGDEEMAQVGVKAFEASKEYQV